MVIFFFNLSAPPRFAAAPLGCRQAWCHKNFLVAAYRRQENSGEKIPPPKCTVYLLWTVPLKLLLHRTTFWVINFTLYLSYPDCPKLRKVWQGSFLKTTNNSLQLRNQTHTHTHTHIYIYWVGGWVGVMRERGGVGHTSRNLSVRPCIVM